MTVSVILITHGGVGDALKDAASETYGTLPMTVTSVSFDNTDDPDSFMPQVKRLVDQMDEGDGVLILTDLFGATPSNIARNIQDHAGIHVIAGLNLPMLLRVLNYPQLPLDQLAEKAISGGKEGVCEC